MTIWYDPGKTVIDGMRERCASVGDIDGALLCTGYDLVEALHYFSLRHAAHASGLQRHRCATRQERRKMATLIHTVSSRPPHSGRTALNLRKCSLKPWIKGDLMYLASAHRVIDYHRGRCAYDAQAHQKRLSLKLRAIQINTHCANRLALALGYSAHRFTPPRNYGANEPQYDAYNSAGECMRKVYFRTALDLSRAGRNHWIRMRMHDRVDNKQPPVPRPTLFWEFTADLGSTLHWLRMRQPDLGSFEVHPSGMHLVHRNPNVGREDDTMLFSFAALVRGAT